MTAVRTDLTAIEKEIKTYVRENFSLSELSDEELFEKVKELVMKRTADMALPVSGMVTASGSKRRAVFRSLNRALKTLRSWRIPYSVLFRWQAVRSIR